MSDVIDNVRKDRHPIVLTERREHAETINNLLKKSRGNSIILKGAMKAAEHKRVDEHLQSAQVVVATGIYVGEGFDLPRLDLLFLVMPITWKGSLAYVGRIHRESDGQTQVTIHDYVDCRLPMLQRMFIKREKSYKSIGYTILFSGASASKDGAKQLMPCWCSRRFPDCSRAHAAHALRYHASINYPFMVSMLSALLRAIDTMKNTIDNADYIIDLSYFIVIFQYVMYSCYSHSVVNEPFIRFNINGLLV